MSIYLFYRISKDIYFNLNDLEIFRGKELFLVFLLLIFFPIFYLLTHKLIYLVNHLKKIDFNNSFKATIIAYNYNLFLPAKSGDFFRYKYLDLNISFKNFFNINVIEKLISLFVLTLFVIISYSNLDLIDINFISLNYFYFTYSFFLLLSIYLLFKISKKENFFITKLLKLSFFDLSIWTFQFLQIIIIINILEINIDIFKIIFIFGSAIIFGLIPISIGGFGVRDYVIFYLFENMNIEANIIIVLFLFNLRYLLPVFVGLLVSLNDYKYAK